MSFEYMVLEALLEYDRAWPNVLWSFTVRGYVSGVEVFQHEGEVQPPGTPVWPFVESIVFGKLGQEGWSLVNVEHYGAAADVKYYVFSRET